jgi:hypothetical protein
MKNRQILILVAVLLLAVAIWRGCASPKEAPVPEEEVSAKETPSLPPVVSDASTPAEPVPEIEAAEVEAEPVAVDLEAVKARFSKALNEVGPCLGLNSAVGDQVLDATVDNWVGSMKPDLGEPVLQTEDWSNTELQVGDEKRRLRVEMDYSGEDRIVRRLRYDRVNADGTFEPIPLTTEQSEDPNETFLASLESDGQVVRRERAQRIYFAGGEEVVVTERDGHVAELDMSRNGKTYRCRMEDPSPDACRCL